MELEIKKAIVHVLDQGASAPVFSDRLLELGDDEADYIASHLEKAYYNDAGKSCTFLPDSDFPPLLLENDDFVKASKQIAERIFGAMVEYPAIPSADLFVILCQMEGHECVAVLKMNYKAAFAHYYQQVEGCHYNALIKQRTILPPASSKPDESFIVDMTNGSIRLVEKKYDMDGVKGFYLSEKILKSTQAQPERARLQAVQAAAVEAVRQDYDESKQKECEVTTILAEEAVAGGGNLQVEKLRSRLEEEFPLAVETFDRELENTGISVQEQVQVSPARIKKMEYQSVKTESGIELKIPTNLLTGENDYIQFINEPDGTINMCKNTHFDTILFEWN